MSGLTAAGAVATVRVVPDNVFAVLERGVIPVVKAVAAVAGDVVDVSDSIVRVNGRPWPYSAIRRISCFGMRIDMRLPSGRYVIAPDSVFLMGVNPCSWDSRYWGSLSRTTVARWNPIITLPLQEKRKST